MRCIFGIGAGADAPRQGRAGAALYRKPQRGDVPLHQHCHVLCAAGRGVGHGVHGGEAWGRVCCCTWANCSLVFYADGGCIFIFCGSAASCPAGPAAAASTVVRHISGAHGDCLCHRRPARLPLPRAMEEMEAVRCAAPQFFRLSFRRDTRSIWTGRRCTWPWRWSSWRRSRRHTAGHWARRCFMMGTLMLASKGVAGVPRAVLVVLLATASYTAPAQRADSGAAGHRCTDGYGPNGD